MYYAEKFDDEPAAARWNALSLFSKVSFLFSSPTYIHTYINAVTINELEGRAVSYFDKCVRSTLTQTHAQKHTHTRALTTNITGYRVLRCARVQLSFSPRLIWAADWRFRRRNATRRFSARKSLPGRNTWRRLVSGILLSRSVRCRSRRASSELRDPPWGRRRHPVWADLRPSFDTNPPRDRVSQKKTQRPRKRNDPPPKKHLQSV